VRQVGHLPEVISTCTVNKMYNFGMMINLAVTFLIMIKINWK